MMKLTNEFFDNLRTLLGSIQIHPESDGFGACPVRECYFFYLSEEDSLQLHRLEWWIPVQQYPNQDRILPAEIGCIGSFRCFKVMSLRNNEFNIRIRGIKYFR